MTETYVIVGAGAAGLAAVRAIRRRDPTGRIVVVTAETCPSYSPALLPYFLAGEVTEKGLFIAGRAFFAAQRAELRAGKRAVGVDFDSRRVFLNGDEPLAYTKLLLATGALARSEVVPGASVSEPLTLRTYADALRMRAGLRSSDSVAVLGAGLAGLEIAMAARKLGKEVTVLARSERILSRNADGTDAALVQRWLENAGIRFLLGVEAVAVEGTGSRRYLVAQKEEGVPAGLLVAAKGAAPNVEWAQPVPVGATAAYGLEVDSAMRTRYPDVFAAGDAARSRDAVTGGTGVFSTWPSACAEGRTAGLNMAGGDAKLEGEIAANVLPVLGRRVSFLGCTTAEARAPLGPGVEEVLVGRPGEDGYRRLWFHDGRLVGAVVVGPCRELGVLRHAIETGARLRQSRVAGGTARMAVPPAGRL